MVIHLRLALQCSLMWLQALDSMACKRRVLLSGTPMQNHLDEVSCATDCQQDIETDFPWAALLLLSTLYAGAESLRA